MQHSDDIGACQIRRHAATAQAPLAAAASTGWQPFWCEPEPQYAHGSVLRYSSKRANYLAQPLFTEFHIASTACGWSGLLAAPSTEVARKHCLLRAKSLWSCPPEEWAAAVFWCQHSAVVRHRFPSDIGVAATRRCDLTRFVDHVLLTETCRQRGLVPHLKSGPLPSLAASTSHRCGTGCLSDAGVAATRSAKYPTGHMCFSSWKPGCMYSMRPSSSTVDACETTAHSRCNRHSLLFFEAPGRRFSASRRHILKGDPKGSG